MSQHIPRSGAEVLPLPAFHDDEDLFDDDASSLGMSPRHRLTYSILFIVFLLFLLTGIMLIVTHRTHSVYQTKKVILGDLALTITTSGVLHTNVYTVNFIGNGKLAAITVTPGQQVQKNQLLAKLDPTSLQNALNEAQASVDAAQTALDNANANYAAVVSVSTTAAASTFTPNSMHRNPGEGSSAATPALIGTQPTVVPAQQFSNSQQGNKVQKTEAWGQIKAAQKALALARTRLAAAQYNLNNAVLKAPHAGTIATLNGVVGGEPGATFIQIVDSSSLQLQANVKEADIGAVAVGNSVRFTVDAYPGQWFRGNVMSIAPLGQSVSGKVTYPVFITIVSVVPADIHLFPTMTAHATITTTERRGIVVVPGSALAFARASVGPLPTMGNRSLVKPAQMREALIRAEAMVQNLQQDNAQENPTPAVVLERTAYDKITLMPIVVGLTNRNEYEVLDGLSVNDVVLVGARMSNG